MDLTEKENEIELYNRISVENKRLVAKVRPPGMLFREIMLSYNSLMKALFAEDNNLKKSENQRF